METNVDVKLFLCFQIIAFDELKTDYKNPIDQCQSLNPHVLPEYIMHMFFNVLFLFAGNTKKSYEPLVLGVSRINWVHPRKNFPESLLAILLPLFCVMILFEKYFIF